MSDDEGHVEGDDSDRGNESEHDERSDRDSAEMNEAVAAFLAGADDVYGEYDRGYMDADAALSVLSSRIEDLRDAAADGNDEGDSDGDGNE